MKVAIIHYWLISSRGGEKVLEEICKLYPEADIYTLIYDTKALTPTLKKRKFLPLSYQNYLLQRSYIRFIYH